MRLTLIAFGTRGDVTPFAALGSRLQAQGHDICLATHRDFESLATNQHLRFQPVSGSYQDFIASAEGRRALGVPYSSPKGLAGLFNAFRNDAEAMYREAWEATEDADGIVTSAVAAPAAKMIAARRGLPLAWGLAIPSVETMAMPHPAFPAWPLGRLYNRATYVVGSFLVQRGGRPIFDRWRAEANRLAGAGPRPALKQIGLVAVSPQVVPRPYDWPDSVNITGYWWLPPATAAPVPDHVRAFVESGPPPICLGFGSMMDDNPAELRAIVSEALAKLKMRAVVVGGSGSALFGFGSDNVCEVPFVSYDWLFSKVSAVVHQGGAGTASFCLTAGVPQVVVKYCLDHTFWAWRLASLGVAPRGLVRYSLTADALASSIRQAVSEPGFRARAVELAPIIRAEDGLGHATRLITDHFTS